VGTSPEHEFSEFAAARGPALFRVALALTGSHHAAEDLLQSVLERTFARWRHIRTSPEAYARTALYRTQVGVWRRRSVVRELPVERLPDHADGADDLRTADLRVALRQALRRLGPRQRAVLVARFYEDLTDEQTARLLGCSTGTVRSQTHRALARLRQLAPELSGTDLATEGVA
jgi:RNA polymerase sigma-70 factor (sigma-E family)